MVQTSVDRRVDASIITELSVLHEISSLRFSESEESFAREVVEKVARLFGVKRLALFIGTGHDQRLIASLACRDERDISILVEQNQPNKGKLALGASGGIGTLYVEQEQPIDSRQWRLYNILARQLEQNLELAIEAAKRKQVQAALEESEERYRALIEMGASIGESIVMLQDTDEVKAAHIFSNEEWARITGYTTEELKQISYWDIVHPRHRAEVADRVKRRLKGENIPGHYEISIVTKDGKELPVEVAAGTTIKYNGKPTSVAYIRDITERRWMEAELRQSEEFNSSVLQNSPNPVLVANPDASIRYVNPALEELTGFTLAELVGQKPPYPWWPEDRQEKIENKRQAAFSRGLGKQEELFRKKNGERFWVELTAAPVIVDGEFRHYIANWVDITGRKRIEEALRRNEARLAQLYDEAPVAYHELDREGRMTRVNRTELDMLGYTAEEMLGKYVWDFMVGADADVSSAAFAAKMAGTMPPGQAFERTYRRKDGTIMPVLIEDRYIKDDGGKVIGLRSTMQNITERKRAEEEARKFKTISDQADYGVGIASLEGNFIYVNDAYARMHGYEPAELIGKHYNSLYADESLKELEKARVKEILKGRFVTLELWRNRKDGTEFPSLTTAGSIKDEKGEPSFTIAIAFDITERKRAEAEILKFKKIADIAGYGLSLGTPDGVLTYVNESFARLHGYTQDELIGKHFNFLYSEEQLKYVQRFRKKLWRCGSAFSEEVWHTRKDGTAFPTLTSANIVKDDDGNPLFTAGSVIDITERKQWEEELSESEERYRALVNLGANIGEAVVMLQDDERGVGMYTFVSEEWTRITGYSEEELLNMSMTDLIHPRDRAAAVERHQKRMRGEKLPGLYEISIVRKDGTEVPVEITSAFSNYKGKHVNVIYIRDITERKALELQLQKKMAELEDAYRELKKVDQMKDSFLSTVSHELRTPLTSIKGFAEILLSYEEEKETQQEFLNIINEESERLTRLIDDLLDLARLESGRQQWVADRIAIKDIITQAVHAVHSLVTQKGLNIQTDLAPELPDYTGDKDKLIQVVTNLLSNAIKFTPEEGEIKVKAEVVKDAKLKKSVDVIRVSVSDTGIGIEAKDQKAVFERFKQVGDTMTDKPKGTGLGLPICKEIVEHYGGRMWVESKLGKGSTFYFTLPLGKKVKAEVTEPEERKEAVKPRVGKTILVVDDEDHVRRFLSHELSKRGYRVFEANNGQEAISLARKQLPDLITLDVLMPEIDGYDVTTILKNDTETKDIPILIISVIEDKQKAFHLGANDYLTKPFNIGMVMEKISKLLRQAQKTVLVVDDDKALVKSLKYKLEKRGISTYVAYNGKEALQVVHQTPPNLILLDIIMPEMDGYEVMSRLKRNRKTAPIPIVILTGVEIDGGRVKAISLGAEDYVTKTDGLNTLFENIETYINDR